MPKLVIPYRAREQFQAYHDSDKRFAVSVCHRRAGKTVARVNKLIKAAVTNTRSYPPPRYGYLAPYFVQSKDIAWGYLQHYCAPLMEIGAKVNQAELSITLPHNQASIRLYGAENADRMRGLYFDGIAVDEAQHTSRATLSQIILPCLADYQGWLDCSGTPKGWENLLGELVKLAKSRPEEWFLQILRASETGIISATELAQLRAVMSENEYQQEFECSFDAAITGAVYGMQIALADVQGRLLPAIQLAQRPDGKGGFEIDSSVPVHTSWDLGYDDSTAIWWWQVLRGEIHVLDYYENSGQDIPHYCAVVTERARTCGYKYGKHYVPHDAANELLAAGGRSIVQQAYGLGIKMYVVPATSQQNGIEATRKTLDRCWFDTGKCEQGLSALRQYQFEFDSDKKVYRSKPRHDWASHGADAFELMAQIWREPVAPVEPAKPKFLHETSLDELWASTSDRRPRRI